MKKFHGTLKARKGAWFVKVRGSYLPASGKGWLTYIPYIFFIIVGFGAVFNSLLSCFTTYSCGGGTITTILLYDIIILIPYYVALIVIMHWIAKRKS